MINRKNCTGTIRKPLEKEMATHSNILAWRISWTEEPDRQDLVTKPPPPYENHIALNIYWQGLAVNIS